VWPLLLDKLLIEFTKSCLRHTNDQALVEGKNGSIVRKQMGHGHVPQQEAENIQSFYMAWLNVYLNFHRACGFTTEKVDKKGKIRKQYDTYRTPFERFKSLAAHTRFLKRGVTMDELEQIAQSHSDTEYAKLLQQKKIELFSSFSRLGILV